MAGSVEAAGRDKTDGCSRIVALVALPELAVMRAKQSILGLVYTGSEVRRAPLIGMQFLHQPAMGPSDFVPPRARLQAKDLIGLLVRHFVARRRATLPPCRVSLRVLTPGGKPAVQIAFK